MSPPPGELDADPKQHRGSAAGDNGSEPRRRPVDTVDAGRIPSQTTVTVAPDNVPLPVVAGAGGGAGNRTAMNGAIRGAASPASAHAGMLPDAQSLPAHAGVVTRLSAAAVDAVGVVVLAALLDLGAAGARFLWSPVDFRWPRPTAIVTVAVLLAVAVVYLAVGWALTGRTYGSKLMGLRVLSSRYQLLGRARSVLRAVVCVLWPVGLLWCAISRTRRSVADLVVRSVVVYDARPYAAARGAS